MSATRSELLARRGQVTLAVNGRALLAEKRTALMREFTRLTQSVVSGMQGLEERARTARASLAEATALDGPETVGSAAMAATGEISVGLRSRNVAGVAIIELEHDPVARRRNDRGYSPTATTPRVDAAAEAFESLIESLLDIVALELSLRRLAEEITRTTRRVNALEHVVIPRLEEERNYIAMVLNERELENRTRLMRAKNRVDQRAADENREGGGR
ncbi:V/A-type H+-transporting ATPase subunit D [Microbacterium sp. AK009]|uniref:V-type ATP synthase subunit D n=1 Tax=Microbacterium sp. AK009 TaxID=2723068 RepID=UPI0015CAC2CE|nr:V-type ATP synthase subunit D [Microbacterium sp. AK009]NYF16571.1 V/A-type H+-transporting ATPase subunit D [Microbacterium sp. AK009]